MGLRGHLPVIASESNKSRCRFSLTSDLLSKIKQHACNFSEQKWCQAGYFTLLTGSTMVKMLILRAALLLTSCMGSAPGTAPKALSRSAEANRLPRCHDLDKLIICDWDRDR
jgi:hypothetical protein